MRNSAALASSLITGFAWLAACAMWSVTEVKPTMPPKSSTPRIAMCRSFTRFSLSKCRWRGGRCQFGNLGGNAFLVRVPQHRQKIRALPGRDPEADTLTFLVAINLESTISEDGVSAPDPGLSNPSDAAKRRTHICRPRRLSRGYQ